MVRLKVLYNYEREALKDISNPYGAIKRSEKIYIISTFRHISIPYGAIKRSFFICHNILF